MLHIKTVLLSLIVRMSVSDGDFVVTLHNCLGPPVSLLLMLGLIYLSFSFLVFLSALHLMASVELGLALKVLQS